MPEVDVEELIKALSEMENNKSPCEDLRTAEILNKCVLYGKITKDMGKCRSHPTLLKRG